jgi:PAS domain S-box-containing protein
LETRRSAERIDNNQGSVKHLSLRRSELISIAIALVMLLAIGAFTGLDWFEYRDNRTRVLTARRIFENTGGLLLAIADAESAQRGYLLMGDPASLKPFQEAVSRIPGAMDTLSASVSDPTQGERMARLRSLVRAKTEELRATAEPREHGDAQGSLERLRTGTGVELMTSIRAITGEINRQETILIARRTDLQKFRTDRAHLITMVGSGMLLVLLALGAVNISMAAARREQLIADLEIQRGQTAEIRDLLQTTLASIGDAVLVTDNRGRVTFMNRVAESLTGWRAEAAQGKSEAEVLALIDESSHDTVESPVQSVLRDGEVVGLSNHTLLVAKDGRRIPIDDSGAPIRGNAGTTLGVVVVFRDVTHRRAADRERERLLADAQAARADAERQRSHLHSLFQQAPAVINIHLGPDHVYELVHPLAKKMAAVSPAPGMKARDAGRGAEYLAILDEVYSSGEPRTITELEQPDGSYFNYICCPWREADGSVAGVMSLAIDVTEQVRARRAMQATEEQLRETARLESLGVLAGGIAHDFNNLLVGIIGNASLALATLPADSSVNGMINDVLRAGERAATLTRQMLAYSGKGRFLIENVDISELVEEMLPLIQGSVPKTVLVRTQLARGLPPVEADAAQLHQVFMNLVINAAEACEGQSSGLVTVTTGLQRVDERYIHDTFGVSDLQPGLCASLEVTDNGSGMDEATRAKIFDPFFTTKFTGRGLGLSAVLGIIRSHKGAVKVHTEPGKGSTFRVLFPASAAVQSRKRAEEPFASPDSGERGTVLLVDDEEIVRRIARAGLEQLGYHVIEAENGVEAVGLFRQNQADISLVLLDLTMPVMSGEETLRKLTAIDPNVRVILSSGFNEADATKHFDGRGLAGFLQKPYTLTRLSEKLRAATGKATERHDQAGA